MKKSYSSAERKSYKRGFFAGLFASKKKKKVVKKPAVKRKQSPSVWHNAHVNDPLYMLAGMYAERLGHKFDLSRDQIMGDARTYYLDAKRDPNFAKHLYDEYGLRLDPEDRKKFLRSRR